MFQYWTFVISILTAFFVAVQSRNLVLKFSTNESTKTTGDLINKIIMGLCAFFLIFMSGCDNGTVSTHFPKFEGFIVFVALLTSGIVGWNAWRKKDSKVELTDYDSQEFEVFLWVSITSLVASALHMVITIRRELKIKNSRLSKISQKLKKSKEVTKNVIAARTNIELAAL